MNYRTKIIKSVSIKRVTRSLLHSSHKRFLVDTAAVPASNNTTNPKDKITQPKGDLSQHFTEDGQNSLKESYVNAGTLSNAWSSIDKYMIPLVVVTALTVGGGIWWGYHYFVHSPDLMDAKERKETLPTETTKEKGRQWIQNQKSIKSMLPAATNPTPQNIEEKDLKKS